MAYLHNTATEYCSICYSPKDSVSLVSLPCSCTSCSVCLTSWISTQSQELHYQTKEEIRCINNNCSRSFHVQEIFSQFDSTQQETISTLLLGVYVKKSLDIRTCPNTNCTYAGIIDLNAHCQDYLECETCDAQWREKIHLENGNSNDTICVPQKLDIGEILSQVREEMSSRSCPNCGVSIQKNGGCDHITCRKCSYEFCWICSHEHSKHSFKMCKISSFVKFLMIALFCISLFGVAGFSQSAFVWITGLFGFVLNSILLNTFFVLMVVFYDLARNKKMVALGITTTIMGLIAILVYLWETQISMLKIASFEAIVLGCLRVCRVNLKTWMERVQ